MVSTVSESLQPVSGSYSVVTMVVIIIGKTASTGSSSPSGMMSVEVMRVSPVSPTPLVMRLSAVAVNVSPVSSDSVDRTSSIGAERIMRVPPSFGAALLMEMGGVVVLRVDLTRTPAELKVSTPISFPSLSFIIRLDTTPLLSYEYSYVYLTAPSSRMISLPTLL